LVEAIANQPGTIARSGNPCDAESGSSFIA